MSPRRHIERIENAGNATLRGVARSMRQYRSKAMALVKRHPARPAMPISIRMLGATKAQGPSPTDFAEAWHDLQAHPALQWIPPVWRTEDDNLATRAAVARHIVRAVDRNLVVNVDPLAEDEVRVLLATGPLRDRQVGSAIDPTTPRGIVDPDLNVSAPTFEEAVIRLRNKVVHTYGPVTTVTTTDEAHGDKTTRGHASPSHLSSCDSAANEEESLDATSRHHLSWHAPVQH